MASSIWCIGKNYALHAKELGQPLEKEPVVFIKSPNCIVEPKKTVHLPSFSKQIEYEVELALLLDDNLRFSHITVALDLTARDVQSKTKENGLPWTLAKSFKESCPLGSWTPFTQDISHDFLLHVNGILRQKGSSKNMIFSFEEIRDYLIKHFPLAAGDIVLTGTPEGISKAAPGDRAEVFLGTSSQGSWTFA